MIKAIETQYKGCRFRSRLEARWAVFFNALGVQWEYEKEGYDLGAAGRYLPDFWLPALNAWVEIKPAPLAPLSADWNKARELSDAHSPVIAVYGEPDKEVLELFCSDIGDGSAGTSEWAGKWGWDNGLVFIAHDRRVPHDRPLTDFDWNELPWVRPSAMLLWRKVGAIQRAYDAARSARFEHGESPR